jgi:hypothetical protein
VIGAGEVWKSVVVDIVPGVFFIFAEEAGGWTISGCWKVGAEGARRPSDFAASDHEHCWNTRCLPVVCLSRVKSERSTPNGEYLASLAHISWTPLQSLNDGKE